LGSVRPGNTTPGVLRQKLAVRVRVAPERGRVSFVRELPRGTITFPFRATSRRVGGVAHLRARVVARGQAEFLSAITCPVTGRAHVVSPDRQTMEPLWSPVVATRGNRSQIAQPQERRNKPKPLPRVATGCLQERIVRRGRRFESVRGLRKVPPLHLLLFANRTTVGRPDVHRASTARANAPARLGIGGAERLCAV
jgi:hypothetical protein